jgi:putative flippase GtrA
VKHFFVGRTRTVHIQFLRYLFVGGSSAVLDMFIYALLLQWGMHYLLAAFVAYAAGFSWNYVTSVLWIFESRHPRLAEFFMVAAIAVGGLLWTEFLLFCAVEFLGGDPLLSKIVVLWIVLAWNFGMRKAYVFH